MMRKSIYVILILFTAAGCFLLIAMGNRDNLDKEIISVAGIDIEVEIADSTDARRTGLMNRKSMKEDTGMLFVFESDQRLSFWMKNTYIPLSIAYISSNGTIMEIYDMKPESLKPVESVNSVRYALEMNQGWFKKNGVSPGDLIELGM